MEKYITVSVYREYDIDVSHLDPSQVRISDFAEEEAMRMFEQDHIDGILAPCDFNAVIVKN